MWKMLTARAPDLKVELVEHDATESEGSARWIAHYTFSQTGRPVVNDVQATFRFADGLILAHATGSGSTSGRGRRSGPMGSCSGGRLSYGWASAARRSPV